ncbi:hypothetical protein [Actinomadura alba]|uniref:Secreted protein n=1 Tax=Actinomadura alba TaxID=406431 RepID=A0ABR7LUR8_9ACTN|nr:hypothetical protein [Actinomadura alba]MBC6468592.1 hypothetical protein [Actinomadura alba]
MRKFATATLIAGAAAATVAIGATPAFAATYTVTNGGVFSSTNTTNIQFVNVTTGASFTCTNSSVPGNAPNGTGLSGVPIATLAGAQGNGTFTNCTGTGGSTGSATLTSGSLNLNGSPPVGGVTTGTIAGINASLTLSNLFGTCNATVTGNVGVNTVTYTNSTSTLRISADTARPTSLRIGTASGSGCAGLINPGNSTTFQGSYKVTTSGSTSGPVISSP